MPNSYDSYEDEDGNVWAFDPPYDDDPIDDDDELPPAEPTCPSGELGPPAD